MESQNQNNVAEKKTPQFAIAGVAAALVVGISLVGGVLLATHTYTRLRLMDNVITVSGSAKKTVVSDNARWTGSFSRSGSEKDIKGLYSQMAADEKLVKDYLTSQGFSGVEMSPAFMNVMTRDNVGTKEYTVTQNFEVRGDDVQKVKTVAENSASLANQGVMLQANSVEYYYSKLADDRVSMLPDAIKDARSRADTIAMNSGLTVGSTKSMSMGVVQVLSKGSVDVSDYGSYDTSSIEKDVMITVKATFGLK